jgi:hypothetical protein
LDDLRLLERLLDFIDFLEDFLLLERLLALEDLRLLERLLERLLDFIDFLEDLLLDTLLDLALLFLETRTWLASTVTRLPLRTKN